VPQAPDFLQALLPPHDELVETLREGGERRLRELGSSLGADRIWTEIRTGRPGHSLAAVAEAFEADLIVVGEHGRRRSFGTLLGSTAEQVVRRSPVPVLLARGLPEGAPRRILLPIDTTAHEAVLSWGRLLRDRFDAEVVGFYAVNPILYGRVSMESSVLAAESLEGKLLENAKEWLGGKLAEAGLGGGRQHVTFGDPGHEITAAALRFDADLIVMGSRGAGAISRMLVGSTAGAVLRGATCPVLVVHDSEG
jgi:nucleotide-binding universal stress UspA family protein